MVKLLTSSTAVQNYIFVLFVLGCILITASLFYIWLGISAWIRIRKEKINRPFLSYNYPEVSLLVPAYNEEKNIAQSIKTFLNQEYPIFEMIVINDGSKDKTKETVLELFNFRELPLNQFENRFNIFQGKIRAIYYCEEKNITLVDKENSGKADSLNCGIELAKYNHICMVDSDSILNPHAFKQMAQEFVREKDTIGVGSGIRVFNGSEIGTDGEIHYSLPKTYIEFCQLIEYTISFYSSRLGWELFKSTMIISGAFGMYRKDAVLKVGGYDKDSIGEDMDLVVRLHKFHLTNEIDYKISYIPDPLCLTEVPSDYKTLANQRNRWQRGLISSIFKKEKFIFGNKDSMTSKLAIPFYVLTEVIAPLAEIICYVLIILGVYIKFLNIKVVVLFIIISLLFSSAISLAVMILEEKRFSKNNSVLNLIKMFLMSFLINFGYRQFTIIHRIKGIVDYLLKRRDWGRMSRQGFRKTTPAEKLT